MIEAEVFTLPSAALLYRIATGKDPVLTAKVRFTEKLL